MTKGALILEPGRRLNKNQGFKGVPRLFKNLVRPDEKLFWFDLDGP